MKKQGFSLSSLRILYAEECHAPKREDTKFDYRKKPEFTYPYNVLCVCLEGGPASIIDGRRINSDPPCAVLFPVGTRDKNLMEHVHSFLVYFETDKKGELISKSRKTGQTHIHFDGQTVEVPLSKYLHMIDARKLVEIIKEIKSCRFENLFDSMKMKSLLLQGISIYCNAVDRKKDVSVHREAERLRSLIEKHAFEDVTIGELYSKLSLCSGHTEALFLKSYMMPPMTYRNNLRLNKARELLISSQLNISQIAYKVGFNDPKYFTRLFKKTFGIKPSSFILNFRGRSNQLVKAVK